MAKSVGEVQGDASIRDLSIEAVRRVLEEGLMVVVNVSESGFCAWGARIDEVVGRVDVAWRGVGRPPEFWGIPVG